MEPEVIQLASDKHFTDFSTVIKSELKTKLGANSTIADYNSEYNEIQELKSKFVEINTTKEN